MISEHTAHPAKNQLIAFGQGKLAGEESSQVESHLEVCPECCETLLDLKDDTFVGLVKIAQPSDSDRRMGTLVRPELESGKTESDKTGTGKSAHPTDGGIANDSAHSATMLVQSGEAVSVDDLPTELQDHPRYRIVELIGRGGMGNVYRAEHRLMNRAVAIKLINAQLMQHPHAVERFRREVQAAAMLSHPNIVAAYDAEQAGDAHFLVMEFVEGTDLASVVKHRGPMSVSEACECIRQVAVGLQHAHEKGMVHRDIKPHNLMLAAGGQVRILDFGLAGFATESAFESSPVAPRQESRTSEDAETKIDAAKTKERDSRDRQSCRGATGLLEATAAHLTTMGSVMGTPDYMAPEQAVDAHSADIRADIYSLGCTLHFLLTGKPPFEADNLLAKLKAHAEHSLPSLTTLRSDVPTELANVVSKMMAKNPAERFQTPAEVAEALAPITKPAASPPKRRVGTLVAAAALFALLAGVIFVQTDKGRIEIQSEVDDVEIAIKQGGKVIEVIDAQTGSQIKWLSSGKYDVELKGDRNDVEISKDGFKLTRWGKEVVTLKRKPERLTAEIPPKSKTDLQPPTSPQLSVNWGEFINPDGASNVRKENDRVTMTVPAGDRTQWSRQGPASVPRLVREVEGDFIAQVKIAVWSESYKDDYRAASLVVWNNDQDFHEMKYEQYPANDNVKVTRFRQRPVGGVTGSAKSLKPPFVLFKIERHGDELSTSWSRDGMVWEKSKEPVTVDWPRKAKVGVAVHNRGSHELGVQFENLKITPPSALVPFDEMQARSHQEAWAKHLGVPVEYTNSIGMKFRLIPPGEFTMGSSPEEIAEAITKDVGDVEPFDDQAKVHYRYAHDCAKSEGPQHKVNLTQPIYLGIHEVTQAQFDKVLGRNPAHFASTGSGKDAVAGLDTRNHPVELTSWNDAAEFCEKLGQQEDFKPVYFRNGEVVTMLNGTGYRLPTEAEWEYSNRAGTTTKYSFGDQEDHVVQSAWIGINSGLRTHPVGELKANPFGLCDMNGNVWEWCQDSWELNYFGQFADETGINPSGPAIGDGTRMLRGCSWFAQTHHCRASTRHHMPSNYRDLNTGFRVSLPVAAVKQAREKPAGKNTTHAELELPKAALPLAVVMGVNLLTDPSFENTGLTQLPRDWRAWLNDGPEFRCEVIAGGHTGQRCLQIRGKGTRGVVFANDIKADRSKRYALKGWAKFEGDKDARAIIKFNYFKDSEFLGVHDLVGTTADQPGWQLFEKTDALDAYPTANHFYAMCHVEGSGTGWFDDLELVAYDRDKLPIDFDSRHGRNNRLTGPNSLERWVGAWETEYVFRETNDSPNETKLKLNTAAERTLGDYFLLSHIKPAPEAPAIEKPVRSDLPTNVADVGLTERLLMLTFDQNVGAFRHWLFSINGKVYESRGQWDDATKTLELRVSPDASNLFSTERFIDAEHVEFKLRQQFVMGSRDLSRWTTTRQAATAKVDVPVVNAPAAEPAKLSLLHKLVGEWTIRETLKPSVWIANGQERTSTEKVAWILGGRFLMARTFNEKDELTTIWLATYEPSEKSNRFWFFSSEGRTGQWRVTWDASSRGFHWRSIDMPTGWIGTGFNRWVNDDTFDNQALIKDENGRVLLDGTQDKRRKK